MALDFDTILARSSVEQLNTKWIGTLIIGMIGLYQVAGAQTLQSPQDFLGYEPGERFTRHHTVVSYFEHLDKASPLLQLHQYGETNEGRPLLTAYISSPENLARLDEIRSNNLSLTRLSDGSRSTDGPVIVWLSYGVHGNESSSTEAAIKTAYELVSGSSSEVTSWLDNAVIILDPCLNPDGRDRYVNWFNRQVGRFPSANQDAREHSEPWPGGRTNHYYFDLNRDWSWLTQKETRHRVAAYQQWMPQIHVDFHEQSMNSPYYFAPAAEPYHELITEGQRRIEGLIGANNRRYFDANDWLYFTREQFDLLYPGYGDTWPVFNGAIGMTYEQAGSGRAGLLIENDEDLVLTLTDRVNHHFTAGLSTIEAAVSNREEILTEFAQYYDTAVEGVGPYANYVISGASNSDDLAALQRLFDGQGIQYRFASESVRINGYSYASRTSERLQVEAGDLVIPSAQPKSRLLNVLMEPQTQMSDTLTYDITAWTLPYMYNLSTIATADDVPTSPGAPRSDMPSPENDSYAYLLTWESESDVRVLAKLLRQDVHVRFATSPFTIGEASYPHGTLIVTSADNGHLDQSVSSIVAEAAASESQPVYSVSSGFVDVGSDFGSSNVRYLSAPSVLLLGGSSISSSATGELWNYFDNQIGYPVTFVDQDDFNRIQLDDYDVVVLPSGSYANILDEGALNDLSSWARSGGTIVAVESAAAFLAGSAGFNLKQRSVDEEADSTSSDLLKPYAERNRERLGDMITGAIFKARVDNTHPLAFGYSDSYYTLKRSSRSFEYLERGWNVAVLEDGAPVSGFVGHRTHERTSESLVWGHQSLGSGNVVYFIDNPIYRGFWQGGKLALANAVFLVSQ